jgi:hypothetical protein
MTRLAPDIALEGRILGQDAPLHVELRRGRSRWTVVVFEPAADVRRLYELASIRPNFTAEDAHLLVVTPAPAEWAEQRVHVVHDARHEIRDAFGARGRSALVIAPDGVIHHVAIGPRAERAAIGFIASMRTGEGIRVPAPLRLVA